MAPSGYDGSIRIDTKMDGRGFNLGIRGIMNSLKGLISLMAAAFGVQQVASFGKTAVDAASQMAGALTGLQSVLDGQGRSFARAKEFINAYTRDGLIPATNAIKSYQNLALRGYSDEQISTVMTALKDSSAFGRRASLSMGEAVQTATEGLRNENSILVDNAGVTKNVAKMWDDYARSIGTTAANLTQAQKVQAEVNGILEETKFQTGDAAKAAGSYAGLSAGLATSFYNLKVAIGNALIPILSAIIPYIKAVVDWLVVLFNIAARLIGLFFGVQASAGATAEAAGGMAEGVEDAAGAAGDLADNTKKAGKAAKGALAAFDDISVLASEAASSAGGAGGGVGAPIDPGITIGDPNTVIPDELAERVAKFKTALMELLAPARESFAHLRESLAGLGKTILEALGWAWENVLKPLGEWLAVEVAPRFLELLADGLDVINLAIQNAQPLMLWLWDNLLKPLGEWTGAKFLEFLDWMEEGLDRVKLALEEGGLQAALDEAKLWFVAGVISLADDAWRGITEAFWQLAQWFADHVWIPIFAKAREIWESIKQKWGEAGAWFRDKVSNPVKDAFGTALGWVDEKWRSTWTGIKDFVKGVINSIIDLVNGMISAVAGGINSVIGAMNGINVKIPDWVPGFGGQSWGLSIPSVPVPQIPRLATGAVIPAGSEFLAVLGDQRSGRNLEAPEGLIRQIIREELADRGEDMTADITLNLDGEVLYRNQQRIQRRRGSSLIAGGAPA